MQIRPLSARDRFVAEPVKRQAMRPDDDPPDELAFMLPSEPARHDAPPPKEAPPVHATRGVDPAGPSGPHAADAIALPDDARPRGAHDVKVLDDAATLDVADVELVVAPDEVDAAADPAASAADGDGPTLDARALARAVRAAQSSIAQAAEAPATSSLLTLGLMAGEPEIGGESDLDVGQDPLELDGVGDLGDLGSDAGFDLSRAGLDRPQASRAPERVLAADPGRPIADQVADAVRKLAADAAGDGVIRVRGSDAGDFAAHVRHDGLQLSLRLVAEGGAQRGVLEQRLPELRQALVRAGYHPDSVDVATSDRHGPRRDGHRARPEREADDGIEFVL